MLFFGTCVLFSLIFVLGRLKVKTRYFPIISGAGVFIIVLAATYINDSVISVFGLVLSSFMAVFCGVVIYFAVKIAKRIGQ